MKFLGNLLISISNATIPIGFLMVLTGMLVGAFQAIGDYKGTKNKMLQKVLAPKVEKIRKKYSNEDEQLEHLSELYKEYHFSVITPTVLKVISTVLYMLIIIAVFRESNFDVSLYTKSKSFLWIDNVFEVSLTIIIPLISSILTLLGIYLFVPKDFINKKTLISNLISRPLIMILLSNVFPPLYSLFLFGKSLVRFATVIPTNRAKRKYYDEHPLSPEEVEAIKNPKPKTKKDKKTLKQAFKDLEQITDDILNSNKK